MENKEAAVTPNRIARQMMASKWTERLIGNLDRGLVFKYLVEEMGFRMSRLGEDPAAVRAAAMACAIRRAKQATVEEGARIGSASRAVR